MGESTICNMVREVMKVLWEELCPVHMPLPTTESLFKVAQEFYLLWNLPHCIGAIYGSHLRIRKPDNSGKLYYNYKKMFSIVLQAVVDTRCRFISMDVGGYGHQHDTTTYRYLSFYAALSNGTIKIPEDDELTNSGIILPYFLIGDGSYPLSDHLMKPNPGKMLPRHKIVFNKRLSRARAVVECSFAKICQKWRIFYTTIQQASETAELIAKAVCILHNVIIDLEGDTDVPQEYD